MILNGLGQVSRKKKVVDGCWREIQNIDWLKLNRHREEKSKVVQISNVGFRPLVFCFQEKTDIHEMINVTEYAFTD